MRTSPKLRRQLRIGALKFRVSVHKFRIGYLIFEEKKTNKKCKLLLTLTSKSDKTNCILIAMSKPFDLYLHD